MDKKVLVEIFVPASQEKYDIYLPRDEYFTDVMQMLCSIINQLSNGRFIANDNSMLIDRESGEIIKNNMKIGELNIENGSRFMLV